MQDNTHANMVEAFTRAPPAARWAVKREWEYTQAGMGYWRMIERGPDEEELIQLQRAGFISQGEDLGWEWDIKSETWIPVEIEARRYYMKRLETEPPSIMKEVQRRNADYKSYLTQYIMMH